MIESKFDAEAVLSSVVKRARGPAIGLQTVYNQGACVCFDSLTYKIQALTAKMLAPRLALSFLALSLAALAGQTPQLVPAVPPADAQQAPEHKNDNQKPTESPLPSAAGSAADSKTYKVGPEDVLFIRVWHEADFSGPVSVHTDGKFTMPLIGDLQGAGLTPFEIEQNVSTALAKYIVKPLVTVIVEEVRSKRYYLDGQIARPGEYPLVAPTTVLEAISKAGGLGGFANEKKIYILRGTKRIPFNYKEVIRGKNMGQNILLENDDHIVVP